MSSAEFILKIILTATALSKNINKCWGEDPTNWSTEAHNWNINNDKNEAVEKMEEPTVGCTCTTNDEPPSIEKESEIPKWDVGSMDSVSDV